MVEMLTALVSTLYNSQFFFVVVFCLFFCFFFVFLLKKYE